MSIFKNKRVVSGERKITKYKFHKNDPVRIVSGVNIVNAEIKSRYNVSGINYYKVGNTNNTRVCKENQLINR